MTECPRCGAQTGSRCRTKSGRPASHPHRGRRAPYVRPEPEWIYLPVEPKPKPWWERLMDWLDNAQPSRVGDAALIGMVALLAVMIVWAVIEA